MIYVISSGNYSDYRIADILESEPGRDLDSLYREFQADTGIDIPWNREGSYWDDYREPMRERKEAYYQKMEKAHPSLAGDITYFGYWLVTKKNFKLLDWEEINLDT